MKVYKKFYKYEKVLSFYSVRHGYLKVHPSEFFFYFTSPPTQLNILYPE